MEQKYPEVHFSEWAWIGYNLTGSISNDSDITTLEKTISGIVKDYNIGVEDFQLDQVV